ncbi:RimK/LysX family protein [Marinobacter sp. M216]|uniref:RimK/LysX family protein n=2 Tax=Marinobacteraceae TaxID=2887365 RepID=A0ABT7HGT2_9GAMM|nr:RimK/LysX family protein [Marinobacter sp. M216]MBW7472490.1 RimK/LysX family protein [Marinobacter sp. F4218]MDK9559040.1 RimK/LysX family protein [Marinobacter sp. M216]
MGSKQMRAGFCRSMSLLASGLVLLLAGCSADRYLMVPKENLNELNKSVQTQRATLVTIEGNANARHEKLLGVERESTQSILEAIKTQVEKPSCPPVQPQTICPSADPSRGIADRLKGKLIVGEVERIYLADAGQVYTARIDSGAETSSIDARNITRFERDGSNWVRFDVPVSGSDELITLEKEVSRRVKVIQASAEDPERRVVVELQFAIGDHQQVAEFSLTDRDDLSYEVLIGRNVLRDVMLIDVGREFATKLPDSILHSRNDS